MFTVLSFAFVLIYSYTLYSYIFELGIYDLSCTNIINQQGFLFVGMIVVLSVSNLVLGILNVKYEKSGNRTYVYVSRIVMAAAIIIFIFSMFGFLTDARRPPACLR